jgi:predicted XRE-type DNA-binding protein
VERRKLTQKAAGEIMGLPQSKVSNLMRGRVDGFSAEKLFACLNALGRDIEIKIKKPIRKSRGELSVAA